MSSETLAERFDNLNEDADEMEDSILEGVPDSIKEKLLEMKSNIDNLESLFSQIDSTKIKDLQSKLTQLELAKFNWISIYAINSLFFVYLKNNGVVVKDHPIMQELQRIKNYMTRINEISEKMDPANKCKFRIDKESSARIIKRSLWANAIKKDGKSQINQMVNSVLENNELQDDNNQVTTVESNKRVLENENNSEKNSEDQINKKIKL